MNGSNALRGYQYQFLCTLEHVLQEMLSEPSTVSAFYVESPPPEPDTVDPDIVDFSLVAGHKRTLNAQVKNTLADDQLTAVGLLRVVLRLINSGAAAEYLFITNQASAASADAVKKALTTGSDDSDLLDELQGLAANSPGIRSAIRQLTHDQITRLRRTRIAFDDRDLHEVRQSVQHMAISLRQRTNREIGRRSAGILTGYLVANVLARAAAAYQTPVLIDEMWRHIGAEDHVLAACWGQRDWAPLTGVPARLGDVARPSVMAELEDALGNPHASGARRLCVCVGPSGIGKSTAAAQYLADNAHLYDAAHWLDASTQLALSNSYRAIAHHHSLQLPSAISDSDLAREVKQALIRTAEVWLLVYDNVPSSDSIRGWLPTSGHGHVLVTTTQQIGWPGPDVKTVQVHGMSDAEARQLVCSRLGLIEKQLNSAQRHGLSFLVNRLEMWPLALELSSNYMRDCDISLEDSSEYIEVLLGRSLEDDTSIPISYPRTLVAAIKLAIGALKERAAGSPCAAIAHDVILFSVFTLSRQIPLHMLLASVALEPKEASQLGRKGPLVWNDTKLPLGEIQRELERNSLVKRDEPLSLCPAHGGGEGLGSAAATIAVNEIVQRVIREDIERSGEIDGVLFRFAYHVQSWVSFLYDSGGLHCGHDFIPHAFAVADYALQHDVANMSVALLWGNSANILRVNERFEEAERYLAAELEFLTSIRTDPLVEIQTAVALADTLMRRNDTVATATESALELVGRATALISTADLDDPEPLVEEVWAARGLLAHIRRTQRYDAECQHLQTALEAYTEMLSSLGKKSVNASVLEISEHILSHEPEVAKIKAMALLEDSSVLQRHHPQLFRFVATACAQLHEWVETVQYMRMFSSLIRSKEFHYQDLTSLAIDVGIECIGAILDGDVEAVAVLRSLLRLVDQYELYLRPLHNADAACVLVLYALREVTKNTLDLRDQYLTQVDFSDLRAESPERARSWEALAQLVSSVRVAKPVTDATLDGLPISSHDVDEVQREPLIKSEPWSGPTYDEQRGTVTVGTNPRGDELLWHVHSADGRRVEGGVIVGPAGSGKTNALRLIARELAHLREIVIWFADPSGRHMESLTSMPCVDWAAFDPNEARNVIIGAAAAAKSRLEENVPYLLRPEKPGVTVLLEEGQLLMSSTDDELMDAVEFLATRGPEGGVGLVVTVADADLASFGGRRAVRNALSAVNVKILRPEWGGPGFLDNL